MKRAVLMILLMFAGQAVAQQVRVTVQVIEVPHRELTKWTTGEKLRGAELYDRAVKLVLAGGAEVLDTNLVIARSGEKALTESFAEMIYPTEQEPSDLGGGKELTLDLAVVPLMRPLDCVTFETRNAGTIVEVEPIVSPDGKMVDLQLSYEMVDRASLEKWVDFRDKWGDASLKRPIFDTRRLTGGLTLAAGTYELFNVFTPKPAAVPAALTRQLVFVRADVLPQAKP